MKVVCNIDLHSFAQEPISFKLGVMLEKTKFYFLEPV